MNIDYRRELINILKSNDLYIIWRQAFMAGNFRDAPHIFFEIIPPYAYLSSTMSYGSKYRYRNACTQWLNFCMEHNKEWIGICSILLEEINE